MNILRDNLLSCYSIIINSRRLFFRAPSADEAKRYIIETFPGNSHVEWMTFRMESAWEIG